MTTRITKQNFLNKPKIRSLPRAEKERRWRQHLMSEGGVRARNARGRQPARGRGQRRGTAPAKADKYLQSLINPWECAAKIPDPTVFASSVTSLRVKSFIPTVFPGGETAFLINPLLQYQLLTPSGMTGGSISWNNVWTINSDFSPAMFNLMAKYRVVSCGVRIMYTGPPLSRSGSIISGLIGDTRTPTVSMNTVLEMANSPLTTTYPCHKTIMLTWRPEDNTNLAYRAVPSGVLGANSALDTVVPTLFIAGVGLASDASFLIDYVMNYEVIPLTTTSSLIKVTRSVDNPKEYTKAMNFVANPNMDGSLEAETPLEYAGKVLRNAIVPIAYMGYKLANRRSVDGMLPPELGDEWV